MFPTSRRAFSALVILLCALALTACSGAPSTAPGVSALGPDLPQVEVVAAAALAEVVEDARVAPVESAPEPPVPVFPAPAAWAAAPRPKAAAFPPPPPVAALAAVIVDEASGEVLFDKDAHLPLPPASLTKIATLILALESGRIDEWVEVDVDSRQMPGSTIMGLIPGDRFTLRDLLYGLMLPSGNDAALAVGRHVSGSDERFVADMNQLLVRLGLHKSHFDNPHGLNGNNHVTSAYDLAMLSRYGMSLPGFREIVTAPAWTARGSRVIPLGNINTFLYQYAGADGIKTGYTRRAGRTLASSATRNGHRLYAVILNSPTRDEDARRLLNWAFTNLTWEH